MFEVVPLVCLCMLWVCMDDSSETMTFLQECCRIFPVRGHALLRCPLVLGPCQSSLYENSVLVYYSQCRLYYVDADVLRLGGSLDTNNGGTIMCTLWRQMYFVQVVHTTLVSGELSRLLF